MKQIFKARPSIFIWPILILLPSSLLFLVLDSMLAKASGGWDTFEYMDAAIRLNMAGGELPFALVNLIGSVLWIIALVKWIGLLLGERKAHWMKALALLLGFLSNLWVLGPIWYLVEQAIG